MPAKYKILLLILVLLFFNFFFLFLRKQFLQIVIFETYETFKAENFETIETNIYMNSLSYSLIQR
jgi:cell division protein FtsI/penicillin-binding protein 2